MQLKAYLRFILIFGINFLSTISYAELPDDWSHLWTLTTNLNDSPGSGHDAIDGSGQNGGSASYPNGFQLSGNKQIHFPGNFNWANNNAARQGYTFSFDLKLDNTFFMDTGAIYATYILFANAGSEGSGSIDWDNHVSFTIYRASIGAVKEFSFNWKEGGTEKRWIYKPDESQWADTSYPLSNAITSQWHNIIATIDSEGRMRVFATREDETDPRLIDVEASGYAYKGINPTGGNWQAAVQGGWLGGGTLGNGLTKLCLGQCGGSTVPAGNIKNFRIYNYSLSDGDTIPSTGASTSGADEIRDIPFASKYLLMALLALLGGWFVLRGR